MKSLGLHKLDVSRVPFMAADKEVIEKDGLNKVFLSVIATAVQQKGNFDSMQETRRWDKVWDKIEGAAKTDAIELSDEQFDFIFSIVEKFKPKTDGIVIPRLAVILMDYLERVKIEQKDK